MKYENTDNESVTGTHLVGNVTTDYDTLVKVFGEPTFPDISFDEKVTKEWVIKFTEYGDEDESLIATIYDWKQYELGTPYDIYPWHVGGTTGQAVWLVQEAIDNYKNGEDNG